MTDIKFEEARKHLADLSDEQLKERFWQLAEEIVQPLLDLGREYTSPSVERSVLMRMGFSSMEAAELVTHITNAELMGKGAGHIVYRYAKETNQDIRSAGEQLLSGQGWDVVSAIFKGGKAHE